MYSVKPIGIDIKNNDRDCLDGSLQESINMQWRDGAFKPIPERLVSDIDTTGYNHIILHKVSDENTINVLGFNSGESDGMFLAFDLASFLGGHADGDNMLDWFGTITDGVYAAKGTVVHIAFARTTGMSFTILNGLIYFMGDGSSTEEQYYFRLQYNQDDSTYGLYDMYKWKTLIPYYPLQAGVLIKAPKKAHNILSTCGVVLFRFALVLKSGEVVLPSPIYAVTMFGLNRSDDDIIKDTPIQNIHTAISLNLQFADTGLFSEEISAINVYASTPFYKTKLGGSIYSGVYEKEFVYLPDAGTIQTLSEQPFYLIKTVSEYSTAFKVLLRAGLLDDDLVFDFGTDYYSIDATTIAAGEIMPVDSFSYHRIFGKIGSYNGRLDIIRPVTVLSGGHIRALATTGSNSFQGYDISTEDGAQKNVISAIDKKITVDTGWYLSATIIRGILSYPDYRATAVGIYYAGSPSEMLYPKSRKNASCNLSCVFGFSLTDTVRSLVGMSIDTEIGDSSKLDAAINYDCVFSYLWYTTESVTDLTPRVGKYSSDNRLQFAQIGEFRVWPALNSYRIGEGKVMALGTGSVNPTESFVISPIIIGTTDGIYTINLDPTGNNFISSITKTKNIPMISEEILEIDNNILFVGDQGLMVFSNGDIQNLTKDYFPQQGTGNFPEQESVFGGYNSLFPDFFEGDGNPFVLGDIVVYMKGALLAFDGRRENIWCSNPDYNFSLVFNLSSKQWSMSTLVFYEKPELYSILKTDEGEIYSRYMVKSALNDNLLILSGEDPNTEVFYHILTRPIKFMNGKVTADDFKVLPRMISRTVLIRGTSGGYLAFGLWGQQEVNKFKKSIPLALKKDDRSGTWPDNTRYHIPINCRKGKYKTITVLQSGKVLPESYISSFDFDIYLTDNNKMR